MGQVCSGQIRHIAPGPSRDDHGIRGKLAKQNGCGRSAKPHLDCRPVDLADQPIQQAFVRGIGQRRNPQGPAEARPLFDQSDAVSFGVQAARGFHSARPSADHDIVPACHLRRHPIALKSGFRIDRAAHRLADIGGRHAGVAVDAGPDRLGRVARQFGWQVRIGQQRAAHGEEIVLACSDVRRSVFRLNPSRCDHRHLHCCTDRSRSWNVGFRHVRNIRGGMKLAHSGIVIGCRRNRIDPGRFDQPRRFEREVESDPAVLAVLGRIELDPDREVRPDRLAHRADHPQQQAQAVFQAAAVFIGAGVGLGRDERGQQIAVPAVDLDRVEPGHLGPARRRSELADHLVDVGRLQHF